MIENELKYLLNQDVSEKYLEQYCGFPAMICQGYLPGKGRLRSKTTESGSSFYFTYKLPVEETVFEIEKKISINEFETMWEYTSRRLMKLRYLYMDSDVQWDIDIFLQNETRYFVMAEAEMPEQMIAPSSIPKFLEDIMLYPVPRSRFREFTSGKLSNPEYAAQMLTTISLVI